MNYIEKLKSMESLEKGWDSYNADPPNAYALVNTKRFIELCEKIWRLPDRLMPSAVGGIGVCFYNKGKKCYFEFYNKGNGYFLFYEQDSGDDWSIDKQIIDEIKDFTVAIEKGKEYLDE